MNALEFLRKQHEEIRVFCAKLRELRGVEARRRTVTGLARLVRAHASLEEEYLYPKLENEADVADLVDGAYRDHEHLDEVVPLAPHEEVLVPVPVTHPAILQHVHGCRRARVVR